MSVTACANREEPKPKQKWEQRERERGGSNPVPDTWTVEQLFSLKKSLQKKLSADKNSIKKFKKFVKNCP